MLAEPAPASKTLSTSRSLTHPYPLNGTVYAATAIADVDTRIESQPRDKRQWLFIGSLMDYSEDQQSRGAMPEMPRNVALPFVMGSKNEIPPLAGLYGEMPGMRYDPIDTDFTAEGTALAPEMRPGRTFNDPLPGIRTTVSDIHAATANSIFTVDFRQDV